MVGLGQAMVDYAGWVGDEFLREFSLEKGQRHCIGQEDRGRILEGLDAGDFKVSAGGSLSNTLVALARLGSGADARARPDDPLLVAMAGPVGDDPVGAFYRAELQRAGVSFLSPPGEGTTGTVVVLTSPDAQRTMLSHQGSAGSLALDAGTRAAIRGARLLLIEGYLWEMGATLGAVREAIAEARAAGAQVALTASDSTLVERHREDLLGVLAGGVDILFANADEARVLGGSEDVATASAALAGMCPLVATTDGHKGSCLYGMGRTHNVPPHWMPAPPVDTCGAGDAYAAGVLYALLQGAGLDGMGRAGARVASSVISQRGARLGAEDARQLVARLPMHMHLTSRLERRGMTRG